MNHTKIKGTDLVSSSLSLGGVALGSQLNEKESFRLMDDYVGLGGNMIDTAQVYANWLPIEASISEKTIGRWMKSRNNRNELIVTTKGAHPLIEAMNIPRVSPQEIVEDIEDSLKRLQVDTIDLYWLHRDDSNRPVGEILEALNVQVKAGKIRYFGCSNWTTKRIREAQEYAKKHQIQGFSANQMMWSLADIDQNKLGDQTLIAMDEEMKQFHLSTGLTTIPYSSQAHGLFSKLVKGLLSFDEIRPEYQLEINRIRQERVQNLAKEHSLTITQIVLGYLLSQPFSTIPIVGCYTREQLDDCVRANQVRLSNEQIEYLDGLSRG